MQLSNLPAWVAQIFGQGAGASYIRTVPPTTTDPAAASHTLGFPPQTFTAEGAGGTPPDGRDFNGILNYLAAWANWQGAGGTVPWQSAVASAGGYPKGAIVQSAATAGLFWVSTADNNTTNPEGSSPANWLPFGASSTGSNSYGYWEKRADGVLEMWGTAAISVSTDGSFTLTFPQNFVSPASYVVHAEANNPDQTTLLNLFIQTVSKSNGSALLYAQYAQTTYPAYSIDWRAIGRWY